MFIKILIAYIIGYVYIQVEGFYIERFINSCISKNILLWNIKREKSTIMYAKISIKDFRKIRTIAKKTKCKIKIKSKKGVPILLHKYKKRKIFLISLMLVIAMIFGISRFVWNIEVNGLEKIDYESFMSTLKESGIEIGKSKNSINTKDAINQIRLLREDIAWIGINIEGTNVKVNVVETREKPELISPDDYCNIVSNKEAIITKISVQNGMPAVKVGDVVEEGTILAYGYMEGKYTGTRYVHATADIEAKVWYSEEETVPIKQEIYTKTGNEEKKYSININNFKINLYKRFSNYENYDTIVANKKLMLFSNLYLPIEFICNTNYETKKEEKVYEIEELKQKTIEELTKKLEERIENIENVVDKKALVEQSEDSINVKLVYTVLENIGIEEKLIF